MTHLDLKSTLNSQPYHLQFCFFTQCSTLFVIRLDYPESFREVFATRTGEPIILAFVIPKIMNSSTGKFPIANDELLIKLTVFDVSKLLFNRLV